MRGLQVLLLGKPRLELDGQSLTRLMAAKHQALVFYLAGADRPIPRARLAALLWGRLDATAARGNLRVALSRLRRLLPGMLDIDTLEVGLSATASLRIDWRELERVAREPAAWPLELVQEVARLWRGPLLDGFELGDADDYDRWVAASRQQAARSAVALRRHLAGACESDGRPDAAIEHLRAWLEIDETDEEAHMALMRTQAACGRRTAAIAQYEACRAALLDRLGARPSADCYALYRSIHADAPSPDPGGGERGTSPPAVDPQAGGVDAPKDDGGFIGRTAELAVLQERLLDPECRWLTIVGPGGVGKTRIAQVAAGQLRDRFPGGTAWFSGREPGDASPLLEVIARVPSMGNAGDPAAAALLVLDNLETLEDARSLVPDLLKRLPRATVLATSRVRVGGSREWLLELGGLDLARSAGSDPGGSPGFSEAARLFIDCLRRVDPAFDQGRHAATVERICRQMDGLPLALEMAAHGARAVGVDAMADRIDAGMALVDTDRQPDDPHRSLDVVLEDSWALLPQAGRSAARCVATLPDEFDAGLAGAVGVDHGALELLRGHSWLGRTGSNRLAMHPLQKRYLRRQPDTGTLEAKGSEKVAAHLQAHLEAVAPFGDLDRLGESLDRAAGALPIALPMAPSTSLPAVFDPSAIAMATDRAIASWPASALCPFVDAATAWLVVHERSAEAAALLARACKRADLPTWRRAGWVLRRAEILNERGEALAAAQAWRHGLQQLGFGDLEADGLLPVLSAALRQMRALQHWPDTQPERRAFSLLVARSLMALGQHLSFTTRPLPMFAAGTLVWLLAARALGRSERTCALAIAAYGSMLVGAPRLSRLLDWHVARRGLSTDDPRLRLLADQALVARRIADGQWQGLLPALDRLIGQCRRLGCSRHELECRSLMAKLAYYQGLLTRSRRQFTELTALSQALHVEVAQIWGPIGEAEAGLILGTIDTDEMVRLLELSRHAMTELENVDGAYTLRWFGLRARVAWLSGDVEAAREATTAGAGACARIPFCGFWAHEGFAGIGEGLIRLRRHERDNGGAVAALTQEWLAFRKPLRAHCRRFAPALSLWHYLHALDAGEAGEVDRKAQAGSSLRASVRCADRQGMRAELARSCAAIGMLENDGAWAGRARRLWSEIGAAPPGLVPGFMSRDTTANHSRL